MRSLIFTVALICFPICFPISSPTLATTRYVDSSVSASGDGTSWATAFKKIQQGIDASSHGDTVIVAEGTYVENIRFNGKNIALTSTDPLDSTVVANTIIDGNQSGSVVTFSGAETETCVFSGFTVRNGSAERGGGICGGTHEKRCLAAVSNNVIFHNAASVWGGGIVYLDGMIQSNVIAYNSAGDGGAGLYYCGGTIKNNVIVGNSPTGDYIVHGGGLCYCHGLIENNTIAGNSADEAAGLYLCNGTIRNCIIWGNVAPRGEQIDSSSTPSYSCIQFWDGDGEGNLDYNPHFVDAASGDYHLLSWSPCIDSGDPASPFSMEPEPNGGRIDMGAYGNTPEATSKSLDTDADGLPDEWERAVFGDLIHDGEGDPDDDRCVNVQEYRRGTSPTGADLWYVDGNVPVSGDGKTWATAFQTIQEGIDAASDDETVIVAQGTYFENIEFKGKNIILQSTDPLDSGVVEQTVIDGSAAGSVVVFSATESPACVLSGFTIRNGEATRGGGICGGGINDHTLATVRCSLIVNNGAHGGGIAYCDGLIEGNRVLGNRSGLLDCDGIIRHNLVSGNGVAWGGLGVGAGGLNYCDGTIQSNTIIENCADRYGGGLYECDGTIIGNLIAGNTADSGGGLAFCGGTIVNNTVVRNFAIEESQGELYGDGGGLYGCTGTIRNCIIWGNVAKTGTELHSSSMPAYSCVRFWSGGGVGNMGDYPYFMDAAKGDYHLKSWSPCIDSGDPMSPFSQEPDPSGGRINMGAYGDTPEATCKSPDADHDGLPDDWEIEHFATLAQGPNEDPDTDGIPNVREYYRGFDPNVPAASWHVDVAVTTSGDGKSWATAFKTVQEGIDAASDGDSVIAAPGIYAENVHFRGKNIVLRSTDPLDPTVVASTILTLGTWGPIITFTGTEDENCVVEGFTIQNGDATSGGGIFGGSMDYPTHATIQNNVITHNSAYEGGGIAYCDGLMQDNLITENSARSNGGGLFCCDGVIRHNRIAENTANGLSRCNGVIENNRIEASYGSAIVACIATIRNNVICNNLGSGLSYCDGRIENDTICNNGGYGLEQCSGAIRNCIVWGSGVQLSEGTIPTYSCIEGWMEGGLGNISYCPHFLDADNGDYHLSSWSPCIDTGDPASPFSQEPQPNGGRVDMGAYGNTPEATPKSLDTDTDGLPDDWEMHFFGDLAEAPDGDFDEDFVPNMQEYLVGSDPTGGPPLLYVDRSVTSSGNGTSWQTAFRTIQEGISAATDGHAVVVAGGTYPEQIHFHGKRIRLRSTDPLDPVVVANTIIEAVKGGRVVTFAGTEDETCVLSGFTIRNGKGPYGGGICGGTPTLHARATIEHNVITGNSATGDSACGGGIAFCDGRIQGNVIFSNTATGQNANGGGLGCCHGLIENNLIGENFADGEGGGLFDCDSVIRGNTISMNSALSGGGLAGCDGMTKNCIIWGNSPSGMDGELYLSSVPLFSCIEEWTGGGKGNISKVPRFVAPESRDFRLTADSPCIDAGSNDPDLSATDMGGVHRIMFGGKSLTVDMGAYEFYINDLTPGPNPDQTTFTWSSLADKTYSIFYSSDLLTWGLAVANFPSSGNITTSWSDDGSLTGIQPLLDPKRFYRLLENP